MSRDNARLAGSGVPIRDDGALEVALLGGRGPDGEILGEPVVLPADYVAEHLALGYASTVHAAQGATVETSHAVVTGRTGAAALYVGMSRGRDANTAHVTTLSGADDPAQGGDRYALHRDPVAVLAGVLAEPGVDPSRSAVAVATEAVQENTAVRTPAELLADAAQLAATERTVGWLDQLTADGLITLQDRRRVAAEDGAASLTRILRRAELAGHDPHQVLRAAVTERTLDGARSVTHVLYTRIADRGRFDPVGESWADWVPHVENPEWRDYLTVLAEAADTRARQLGQQIADDAPAWVVDALGPVPMAGDERDLWEAQAAVVAGVRELTGHDDDGDALGPAPQPGQVEAYAAYRAAWRTLGRPEFDREETELSDGQLRMRVRAWEREKPWAPRYVGNELAGTRQAAAHHHQTAAVRAAEVDAAAISGDEVGHARFAREAADAAALAAALDEQAATLQQLDDARAEWLAHTAMTRVKAERAAAMLAERHAADLDPDPVVTAEEWLAAHQAGNAAEEAHRTITETDLDAADRPNVDERSTGSTSPGGGADRRNDNDSLHVDVAHDRHAPHTGVRDLREVAAAEPPPAAEDVVQVPTAAQTAADVVQARRAIAEIRARTVEDDRVDEQARAGELSRWHSQDRAAEVDPVAGDVLDDGDVSDDGDVFAREPVEY